MSTVTVDQLADQFGLGSYKAYLTPGNLNKKLDRTKPLMPQLQAALGNDWGLVAPNITPAHIKQLEAMREVSPEPLKTVSSPWTAKGDATASAAAERAQPGGYNDKVGAKSAPAAQAPTGSAGLRPEPPSCRGGIDRSQFAKEASDPDVIRRMATINAGEVLGNASLRARQAQLESLFNRAHTGHQGGTLMGNMIQYPQRGGYYPASTFRNGAQRIAKPGALEDFQKNVLAPVLAGK